MLGKLIKTELKASSRMMLPLFLILIVSAIAMSLSIRISSNGSVVENSSGLPLTSYQINTILSTVLFIVFVVAVILVIIMTSLMILIRFYRSLLTNEGYLMFSLPVTTLNQILGKAFTAMIWIILAGVAGMLAGLSIILILGDPGDLQRLLKQVWEVLGAFYGKDKIAAGIILFLTAAVFSLFATISEAYAALSVGHLWGNHRILGAIFAYIGFGVVELLLARFVINPIQSLFTRTVDVQTVGSGTVVLQQSGSLNPNVLILMIAISAVEILVYGFIAWYVLDRKLSLE